MKRLFPVLVLWLFSGIVPANLQAQRLTNDAQVSLLTCVPGAEMYSAYGHSAIRVKDPAMGIDRVYNYGTFDFNTPNFYLKFMRGQLNYKLDVDTYRQFEYAYTYFQRSFDEQLFDLTPDQKQAVYDYLERNYLPENRFYLYDFFFDNCATRIRDVFVDVLGDSLQWVDPQVEGPYSLRDMINLYQKQRPWYDFGVNILLGKVIDRKATHWEEMFLPDFLAAELGKATVIRNGQPRPFVYMKQNLFSAPSPLKDTPWPVRPLTVFTFLLLIVGVVSWRMYDRERFQFVADGIFFFVLGLVSILMLLLWLATDHTATAVNLNVLWALPTHLVAGIPLIRYRRPEWLKYYFLVTGMLTLLLMVGWPVNPQAFPIAVLPILGIIAVRSGVLFYKV